MSQDKRTAGRLLRKVARMDRAWRQEGKVEGRTENALAHVLGVAARAGLGRESRIQQNRSAARLGQRSGWENRA